MNNSRSLINYIKKNPKLTTTQLEDIINNLSNFKEKEVVSFLLKMLENEQYDWRIKNAIAIALGDIGFEEAVPSLMNVVLNSQNNGYSGTFLWALTIKPMQCKAYFLDFVELLCTGSLEIRDSAVILIEEFYKHVNSEIIKKSIEILSSYKVLLEFRSEAYEEYGILGYIEHIQDLLSTRF